MSETTALVCVVSGNDYVEFSRSMFASAAEHFHPTEHILHVTLDGREGWPASTMYRWHCLFEHAPHADFIYMVDADMRWEQTCGSEILPDCGGTVGTQHPGYVRKSRVELPYDGNSLSTAYVPPSEGETYFAGGFAGGEWSAVLSLAEDIMWMIDENDKKGIVSTWHDESALNRALIDAPPAKILSPSYCYPQDASSYEHWWPERFPRILTAIDKPAEVRGVR